MLKLNGIRLLQIDSWFKLCVTYKWFGSNHDKDSVIIFKCTQQFSQKQYMLQTYTSCTFDCFYMFWNANKSSKFSPSFDSFLPCIHKLILHTSHFNNMLKFGADVIVHSGLGKKNEIKQQGKGNGNEKPNQTHRSARKWINNGIVFLCAPNQLK